MIAQINVTWNESFANDGLLYFAQRILEMLEYETIDIYRAPLHNTSSLIDEYLRVNLSNIKKVHLEQVFNEFIDSFEHDIIVKHFLGIEKVTQVINKLKREPQKRQELMEYLCHVVGTHYLSWSKEYLKFIIPQSKEKSKIERAVRCFIPELLKCGYSREEIYHYTKKSFSPNLSGPFKTLNLYLDHYNRKPHKYTVYLGLSTTLLPYKEILAKHLKLSYDSDLYSEKLKLSESYFIAKVQHVSGLDSGRASAAAYDDITFFSAYFCFFANMSEQLLYNTTYVVEEETLEERRVVTNQTRFNLGRGDSSSNTGELTELCIVALASKAQCSVKVTDKIVKLHNRAISNNGLENGLLNLWSILEVICVNDSEKSKINQVLQIAVPILENDYLKSIFCDLYENLRRVLPEESLKSLITSINIGHNDVEKICCLVLLPEFEQTFDTLIDKLVCYPVIRTRMILLHDNCKKRSDLLCLMKAYGKRITWHLYRIYRARNLITHSGGKPLYLKDLGEHLHSYIDVLTHEVILKLAIGNTCHLSNVLIDSELLIEVNFEYLGSPGPINYETITKICSLAPALWEKGISS